MEFSYHQFYDFRRVIYQNVPNQVTDSQLIDLILEKVLGFTNAIFFDGHTYKERITGIKIIYIIYIR